MKQPPDPNSTLLLVRMAKMLENNIWEILLLYMSADKVQQNAQQRYKHISVSENNRKACLMSICTRSKLMG